jgi:hypothetical protein
MPNCSLRKGRFRGRPWSVRKLTNDGRNTKTCLVWMVLRDLAAKRGNRFITPTHALISELTGINRCSTISAALTALHNAGWIQCKIFKKEGGKGTLLIKIRRRNPRKEQTGQKEAVPPAAPKVNLDEAMPAILDEFKTCNVGNAAGIFNLFTQPVDITHDSCGYNIHTSEENCRVTENNPATLVFKDIFRKHTKLPHDTSVTFTSKVPATA